MKTIYLNKATIGELEHNEFMTYVALKTYLDKHVNVEKNPNEINVFISINTLIHSLFDTFEIEEKSQRSTKEKLKTGLEYLIDINIIYLIEKTKNQYYLNLCNLYINIEQGDKYFTMTNNEIKKILSVETKEIFSFFHYALTLFSTIWNGEYGYGCNSIDDLCALSGISKKSAIHYNKLLEENNLIYIKRNDYACRNKNGEIHNQPNTYGRYEDKCKVDKASKEHGIRMFDKTKELTSKIKASIKQRYNCYAKLEDKSRYNKNINTLYEDVLKYNEDYNTIINKKELDLSIFPNDIENVKEEKKIIEKKPMIKVKTKRPFTSKIKENPFEETNVININEKEVKENTSDDLFGYKKEEKYYKTNLKKSPF